MLKKIKFKVKKLKYEIYKLISIYFKYYIFIFRSVTNLKVYLTKLYNKFKSLAY